MAMAMLRGPPTRAHMYHAAGHCQGVHSSQFPSRVYPVVSLPVQSVHITTSIQSVAFDDLLPKAT